MKEKKLDELLQLIEQQRDTIKKNDKLLADVANKVEYFDKLVYDALYKTLKHTAKDIGVELHELKSLILRYEYGSFDGSEFMPSPFAIESELFTYSPQGMPLITPKGRETFRLMLNK